MNFESYSAQRTRCRLYKCPLPVSKQYAQQEMRHDRSIRSRTREPRSAAKTLYQSVQKSVSLSLVVSASGEFDFNMDL